VAQRRYTLFFSPRLSVSAVKISYLCHAAWRDIFCMYLKRLYRHNKFLAVIIVSFALAQLINNTRQDIAISPIYAYGMYSEKIAPLPTYHVPEIFINSRQLQTKDFSPQQWDNIMLPVSLFYKQKEWNLAMWQTDIHRLIPFADSSKFTNNISEPEFKKWYKNHLEYLLNKKIDTLEIAFRHYFFNDKILKSKPTTN
jgi:hypothetical protein